MAHKKDDCDYKSVETATCCYPTDENHWLIRRKWSSSYKFCCYLYCYPDGRTATHRWWKERRIWHTEYFMARISSWLILISRDGYECKALLQERNGMSVAVSQKQDKDFPVWKVQYGFSCLVFPTYEDAMDFCRDRFTCLDWKAV